MTPISYYREQIARQMIVEDQQQLELLLQLDITFHELILEHKKRSRFYNVWRRPRAVKGDYIWGGVGIGKTFIMDCFYHALPFENKMRVHFHQFMRDVHAAMRQHQGERNPLQVVAKQIAKQAMVICFDELIVSDIADAMILRRILQALIEQGVCLIMTSNTRPDDLYLKGLQRISFMPAIALIKQHTHVIHVETTMDYRLQHLQKAGVFHVPNDEIAEDDLEKCFALLTEHEPVSFVPVIICDRPITIRKQAGSCIWFDFESIAMPPRSQHDYLALAQQYKSIFISHIPKIKPEQKDRATLFIRLIDVLYDAKIRLICSAEALPQQLYMAGPLLHDFQRTQSRLIEMQSERYFLADGAK
jgi:cell division protein ZapE